MAQASTVSAVKANSLISVHSCVPSRS
ncbi:UNVERIFIED_CONTAM: hypothetical protein GTU68_041805 [Idotea baltica]|nr:hypothetical protein [Idotea baltica]